MDEGCETLNQAFCGTFIKETQPLLEDIVAYDRFGNGYTEEEMTVNDPTNLHNNGAKRNDSGYFQLNFNSDLTPEQQDLNRH